MNPSDIPLAATPPAHPPKHSVPIRSLNASHRAQVAAHLLGLEPHARYLRFGYMASDEQVQRYADQLDFERDALWGVFNRRLRLIALAHLAFLHDPACVNCAEFGASVSQRARGRGYGGLLFERAVTHARNVGVHLLFIHALSENTAMLRIARRAGARIERDGSESEAYLSLPPADFDSRWTELVDEQMALGNYHIKAQAKPFWALLQRLQHWRQGLHSGA